MMKNAMLILLLAASLSFAIPSKPPIPPIDTGALYGKVFLGSVCSYNMLTYLMGEAQSSYYIYDGKSCVHPDLTAQWILVSDALYGGGSPGLVILYRDVLLACGDDARGRECSDAKSSFYSGAHSARQVFQNAKAAYMQAARQAILDGNPDGHRCGTARSDVLAEVQASTQTFRECMLGPTG